METLPMRGLHMLFPLCLSLFLASISTVRAQVLPFRHFSMADGLPSNSIRALCQDSRGYLWIGTDDGLCSFDGRTFRRFGTDDGLSFAFVNRVEESRRQAGSIWVATNGGGVFLLQEGRFRSYPMGGGEYSERVNALAEDRDGTVWCATDDGVFQITERGVTRFRPAEITREIADLYWLNDSTLWILGMRESIVYAVGSGRLRRLQFPMRSPELFLKLLRDADGDVWIGGMHGTLLRYREFQVLERLSLGGYAFPQFDDDQGNIWVSLPTGIAMLRKDAPDIGRISHITSKNGIGSGPYGPMLKDREGNIWLGGVGHGLYRLENRSVMRFPIREPAGTGRATGDGVDRVWTGTGGNVHEFFRGADGTYRLHREPLVDVRRYGGIVHYTLDPRGDLWVVTAQGDILRYRVRHRPGMPSTYTLVETRHVPVGGEIPVYLYIDRQFRVWCSVTGVGTYLLEPVPGGRSVRLVTARDGLPDNGVRIIAQDARGRMWFGGYIRGAASMEFLPGGRIRKESLWNIPNLPDHSVRSILETEDGTYWIGTRYGGLLCVDPHASGVLTVRDGLPSNAVWSLAKDSTGRVWVGTSQGLAVIDPLARSVVRRVDETAGIPFYAVGVLREGQIWGYTDDGFVLYDPSKAQRNIIPPPVLLTRIEVNGARWERTQGSEFPHDQNNIAIEFLGVSLSGGRPVRYQYRLGGAEAEWHEPTASQSVTYAALSPGRYTFLVRAVNADEVTSVRAATWEFAIRPPFWKSPWFLLLSVVCCGLVIALVVRARLRRLQAIQQVRSRIATDLHDDIGAGLTRITLFSNAALEDLRGKSRGRSGRRDASVHALLKEISATSRELVDSMSDIVWAVGPGSDSFDDVLLRMKSYAGRMLDAKGIDYAIAMPADVARLDVPLEFRRNIFLMFKETMTNIVRHSGARTVRITVGREDASLVMTIADDGTGFDPARHSEGNGIRNLHKRAALIGGSVDIRSRHGQGTTVTVRGRIP